MSEDDVLRDLMHLRATLDDTLAAIAAGGLPIDELLTAVDDDRTYLYAVKAIEAVGGVGKVRARRLLDAMGLDENVRISELSAEQRRALADGARSVG
jgi:hypothetical protein